jgi:hypothetical protein
MITVKQVLIEARDLLINVGWTQGVMCRYKDGKPSCYCSVGAISQILMSHEIRKVSRNSMEENSILLLRYAIRKQVEYNHSVMSFNDAPGRTKEEVIDVFTKAIERA